MKYIIGNWKANKNFNDVRMWVDIFLKSYQARPDVSVIICPPYPFIFYLNEKLAGLNNVFIGAQNISSLESGSFTGEVTAKSLVDIADYVIIGHSERRNVFNETDDDLTLKIAQAKKYIIESIFCIRDEKDLIPMNVTFVSYEPVHAIGTGKNESLENILAMKTKLRLPKDALFLYGGSINENNVKEYVLSDEVNGFVIGEASLDVNKFLRIINSI